MKVAANYHKSLLLCSVEQIFWIWAPGLYATDGHSALAIVSVCLFAAALLEVAACPAGSTGPSNHALPWIEASLKQASRGCKGWNLNIYLSQCGLPWDWKWLSLGVRKKIRVLWTFQNQNAFFATQNYICTYRNFCDCAIVTVIRVLSFLFNY